MKNKRSLLILFSLLCLIQLLIPGIIVYKQEEILTHGKEYKFLLAPIDPSDPFRGKYITLSYKSNRYRVYGAERKKWKKGGQVYVRINVKRYYGFACIESISKTKPNSENSDDYFKAEIRHIINKKESNILILNFPFDRYYMNEFKAEKAENIYREMQLNDTENNNMYGVINIKNGKTSLKSIILNGKPIETQL